MTYLDRAIKDGYAIITGPENKQKIISLPIFQKPMENRKHSAFTEVENIQM